MNKKRILIYGEFSGYGNSLAKGFRELKYHADVLNFSGDGFKKIKGDLSLSTGGKFKKILSLLKLIPKITSYNYILIMNPSFFDFKLLGPLILLLFKLKNRKIFLLCCGDDVEFIRYGRKGMIPNWPYSDISLPEKKYFSKISDLIVHNLVAISAQKIIPVMYDYACAWRLSKYKNKVTHTIPLACDGKITIPSLSNNRTLHIMHGINREDFKGSSTIKLALDEIKKRYPDSIKITYPERLPFDEYIALMNNIDISIDQTKGNSYGMNAIYSMLAGHVVLAPANSHFTSDLSISNCPIIQIENNKETIVNALETLLINRDIIYGQKLKSIDYATEIHNPKKVALKILDIMCCNHENKI